jgi:hypothetical protein
MMRKSASRTFSLSCVDDLVNACICRRSSFGMVHHGRGRVAQLVPIDWAGIGGGGLAVYMTQ